jgi:O-succinylbenzoate synthase
MNFVKRIEYSTYILKKIRVNSSRVGALLKVEWPDGIGYCDLHPWPEFGDAYLKEQFKILSDYQRTPMTSVLSNLQQQSLAFARIDCEARSEKKSLMNELDVPESHYLITREEEVLQDSLADITEAGFKKIKVKVGGDPLMAVINVSHIASMTEQMLRLDVNEQWSEEEFISFAEKIPEDMKARIEFIEDPFHSAGSKWQTLSQKFNLMFAKDFCEDDGITYGVRIIKPAAENPTQVLKTESAKIVVTSYLDHPFGQVCAAFTAAQLKKQFGPRVLDCGLLSQHIYEPNDFSEMMPVQGPKFPKIRGTGFGFDEILKKMRWQVVK